MVKLFFEKCLSLERKKSSQNLSSDWKIDFFHINHLISNVSSPKSSFLINLFENIALSCLTSSLFWPLNEEYLLLCQHMVDHILKSIFLLLSHWPHSCIPDVLNDLPKIVDVCSGISLSYEKSGSRQDFFINVVISHKSIDKILYRAFELLGSSLKIHFLKRQNEFELGCFGKSTIMKIPIWKYSMKTVGVSIAWLVEYGHSFKLILGISKFGLKYVGYLSFWLRSDSHCRSVVFLSRRPINKISVGDFSLERGVGEYVTRWCFTNFGKSEHCDCFIEKREERDVTGFYSFEEIFGFLLSSLEFFLH
jgi:hypothetical protein